MGAAILHSGCGPEKEEKADKTEVPNSDLVESNIKEDVSIEIDTARQFAQSSQPNLSSVDILSAN